jgi:hypothetical protein
LKSGKHSISVLMRTKERWIIKNRKVETHNYRRSSWDNWSESIKITSQNKERNLLLLGRGHLNVTLSLLPWGFSFLHWQVPRGWTYGGGGMAIKKSRKTSSNNTTPLLPIFHLSYFHRAGGVWTRSAQVKAHREIAT